MSEAKTRAFSKKYGTRKEVFDGVACMTRGGLGLEDLFLDDNGVIRSLKQVESLKKSEGNLVRKSKKEEHKEVSTDDDSVEDAKLSVPSFDGMTREQLKEAIKKALENTEEKLPKGHSKWTKQQWIEEARRLNLVA